MQMLIVICGSVPLGFGCPDSAGEQIPRSQCRYRLLHTVLDDIAFRCAHAFCPRPVFFCWPCRAAMTRPGWLIAVCPKISIVFGRRVGESGGAPPSLPMMSDARTLMVDLHLEPVASRRFLPAPAAGGVVHALRVHACFSLCRAVGPPHRHVTGSTLEHPSRLRPPGRNPALFSAGWMKISVWGGPCFQPRAQDDF
jgi:hypothetical protein